MAHDSSKYTWHGGIRGTPFNFQSGVVGNSLSIQGGTAWAELGHPPHLNIIGPITICAFIHPLSSTGLLNTAARGFDAAQTQELYFRTEDGKLSAGRAPSASAGAVCPSALTQAMWAHTCVSWEPSMWRLYVNGTECGTAAGDGPYSMNVGWALGARGGVPENFNASEGWYPARIFRGLLDDVRIYSRTLTPQEVMTLAMPLQ